MPVTPKQELAQIAAGTAIALAIDALTRAQQITEAPGIRARELQDELKQIIKRLDSMPIFIERVG